VKIEHYASLTKEIEDKIAINEIELAGNLVDEYSRVINNSTKYCYKAILKFQNGDVKSAIGELKEGAREHPFSFNIHYNLGFMYNAIQETEKALENFFYAMKYGLKDDDKQGALKEIQNILNDDNKSSEKPIITQSQVDELKKVLNQYDARVYPVDKNGSSLIRKPQNVGSSDEYMVNMYKTLSIADVDLNSRMFFKSELVKGETCRSKKKYKTKGPVVIPISKIDHSPSIKIKVNGEKYKFTKEMLKINQYHYIRITEPGDIEISADSEIFIGDFIELEPEKKPVKLFLKIFVDGLSYNFLEDNGLKELMPNTYGFFNKGFISRNCYTTSEWTLPSKASINTGMYSTNHKMLQPNHSFTFYDSQKLLAEYFQEQGYYCTNICTNWRTTPALGYYRGYNRMIYQNFLGGMDSKEVIMEAIEHLQSFDSLNNFMTLSLMDLHNVPDEIESHLYSQAHTEITDRINKNKKGSTSVQTEYDESKIAKYYQEIKRVDGILGILYDFILKNFTEDEFVITLHSDHGQSFLENDFNLLSDNRLKVPFMMRGKNVPIIKSEELIETVDMLPSILNACELNIPTDIDGRVPKVIAGKLERDYTFTQIIHPNQPYKALINEKGLSYYFETKHPVLEDLSICLEDFKSYIIDKTSGMDITNQHDEKISLYDEVVFNKIKNMLRWSH